MITKYHLIIIILNNIIFKNRFIHCNIIRCNILLELNNTNYEKRIQYIVKEIYFDYKF